MTRSEGRVWADRRGGVGGWGAGGARGVRRVSVMAVGENSGLDHVLDDQLPGGLLILTMIVVAKGEGRGS